VSQVFLSNCLILLLVFSSFPTARGQKGNTSLYHISNHKNNGKINIDGVADEPDWAKADSVTNFWIQYPRDDAYGKHQTVVKVLHDRDFLYVYAKCFDMTRKFIQPSLKRDLRYSDSDGFGVLLDPTHERTNGYLFFVTPYNSQSESQLSSQSSDNDYWDAKWLSATHIDRDYWTAEIAIPLNILQFRAGDTTWFVNFVRNDFKENEADVWARVPINFGRKDLGYTGSMYWDEAPVPQDKNIALIPYTLFSVNKPAPGQQVTVTLGAGADAKLSLSTMLNLNVAVNPDFSQVEADQQIINLTRYNITLPEHRIFFLENSDLFSSYGNDDIHPFYSRSIGLYNGSTIPIIAGVNLTGKPANYYRLGMLDVQTAGGSGLPPQNFFNFNLQRSLLKRSVIKAYFNDKQSLYNAASPKNDTGVNQYGRDAGIETNFTSSSGTWNEWNGYHLSWKPGITKNRSFWESGGMYSGRNVNLFTDLYAVGTDYYADLGFTPRLINYDAVKDTSIRLGYEQWHSEATYICYPSKSKRISDIQLQEESFLIYNPDYTFNTSNQFARFKIDFKNTAVISFQSSFNSLNLLFPTRFFSDTNFSALPLTHYRYNQYTFSASSDSRKILVFTTSLTAGGFYNGKYDQVVSSLLFQLQPHFNITVSAEYDHIIFPSPYGRGDFLLLSPHLEIGLTTRLSWTTYIQYNTQANNININSRFQWQFKPLSNLYIVYTDNYMITPVTSNLNRSLVVKLNYWFNL
jgi:Domain of unknown function (DUF5916)/Carbohydrate family 9 binding domain-like